MAAMCLPFANPKKPVCHAPTVVPTFAREDDFVYPNNYNHFAQYFGIRSSGGILEEVIIPWWSWIPFITISSQRTNAAAHGPPGRLICGLPQWVADSGLDGGASAGRRRSIPVWWHCKANQTRENHLGEGCVRPGMSQKMSVPRRTGSMLQGKGRSIYHLDRTG